MTCQTLIVDPKRWTALVFIALAQLMVVLDGTVVNIALPHTQEALGFSDANRQWVITAYALAFGALLLLGGRISDKWGRRRAFIIGLIGFAAASALGGAAMSTGMLMGARALQGVFGALLAPAALSLLTVKFAEGKERAKAFGVYGAISGAGAAVGLLLGGALTEYLNWRWTLYVNVIFAVIAVVGAIFVIKEPAGHRNPDPIDISGVVLAGAGIAGIVYGFGRAATDGWLDPITLGVLGAAVVLLCVFVLVESRVAHPLLPLRVIQDRSRGGSYLVLALAVIGMFGVFLFMTFYLQDVRGYSPVIAGVAFLPMVVGMMIGATQIGARLVTRVSPRYLMGPGLLLGAIALVILSNISVDSGYAEVLLPGLFLLGLGIGSAFMPAMSLATSRVDAGDAGVASAMVNTSQQIGGAIGTALLNTIATSATAAYLTVHMATSQVTSEAAAVALKAQAAVHGFTVGIWWAAAILALASVLAFTLINSKKLDGVEITGLKEEVPAIS